MPQPAQGLAEVERSGPMDDIEHVKRLRQSYDRQRNEALLTLAQLNQTAFELIEALEGTTIDQETAA